MDVHKEARKATYHMTTGHDLRHSLSDSGGTSQPIEDSARFPYKA